MKNKHGFTLIELLAVIVVLAIIALITVPQILGITSTTRSQANMRSLEGHIRNIDNQLALAKFENDTITGNYSFDSLNFTSYPKKDHIRCEEYIVNNNTITEAKNCLINNKNYCYVDSKAVDCEEVNKTLKNTIINDNQLKENPTLSTNFSNSNDQKGLYLLDNSYYFRGNVDNNYVKFANKIWRIIRINEDGTIRLILDEAIDENEYGLNYNYSTYEYMYYSNGTDEGKPEYPNARYTLENWYQNNIGNNSNYSSKIAIGNYFCEEAKIVEDSDNNIRPNTTFMRVLDDSYIPSFKCNKDLNGHQYVNTNIGLITIDEVLLAGGHLETEEENYYLYKDYAWWTMSPAGVYDIDGFGACAWYVEEYGDIWSNYVNTNYFRLRPVINLRADVTATGTGTELDPYVIQ